VAQEHFMILVETWNRKVLFIMNYQILVRRLFFKNNSAYWLGKNTWALLPFYIVMTGVSQVGILLTILYLKAIQDDKLPNEIETLSEADRYNDML
jgi:oxygen-independent coproporphyrinogen-3 oxidase